MRYNKAYQLTRDIDWFFQLNNTPIHVASAGGKLPNQINDRTQLQKQQHLVSTLPDINTIAGIRINDEFIKELCEKTMCEEEDYEVRAWRIVVIICVIIELGAISCVIHYCEDHSNINPIIFVVFTLIFFALKLGSLFAIKEKPQAKRQIVVKEIS